MRLLCALFCCASLGAQSVDQQQRGRQLVYQALEALGGERFLNVKDRVESGRAYSFYREQLTGLAQARIYTRYLTAPEGAQTARQVYQRERQSFGKNEDYAVLFQEDGSAYQLTWRGARPLRKEQIDRYIQTTLHNFFYILRQRLKEPGLNFEHKGSDLLDFRPVEIVEITDAEGRAVTVYFDRSSSLPLRQVFYRRDEESRRRIEEITVYGKYRDVGGGVQWPYSILRQRDGEKIFEIFSESVQINQNLDDSLFTLPAKMKILPPAKD